MNTSTDRETQIVAVLEALNKAIRMADFMRVEQISAMLETDFPDFTGMDRRSLVRIRALAAGNAACLEASAQGIRAGRRRLAEIAAAGRSDTYDSSGARQALPLPSVGRRL